MKNYIVKDTMVPLADYVTVRQGSSIFEALMELDKSHQLNRRATYPNRAVLVIDEQQRVIGKIGQVDILQALEPKDNQISHIEEFRRFGFSSKLIHILRELHPTQGSALQDMYEKTKALKVEDHMKIPSEGEYIDGQASLDLAIHQLVIGKYLSLLVVDGSTVIGILRMSDVFGAIVAAIKELAAPEMNEQDQE